MANKLFYIYHLYLNNETKTKNKQTNVVFNSVNIDDAKWGGISQLMS